MSTISPEHWQTIEGCFSVLSTDSDHLESELEALIADLDHVRLELGEKAQTLAVQRSHLDEQQRALREKHEEHSHAARQLEQQEIRLREALAELNATRDQIVTQDENAVAAAGERSRALLQQIQHERDDLQAELDSSRKEAASFAELLAAQEQMSAVDREETVRLKQENADLRDSLLAAQAEADREAENSARQVAELEKERLALERELERVRTRAAELQEQVASRERKMETQRDEMKDELRQLRQLVERSAALASEPVSSPVRSRERSRPTDETRRNPPEAASDPVVDSVMAQFAKLQKDVSARRKRTTG